MPCLVSVAFRQELLEFVQANRHGLAGSLEEIATAVTRPYLGSLEPPDDNDQEVIGVRLSEHSVPRQTLQGLTTHISGRHWSMRGQRDGSGSFFLEDFGFGAVLACSLAFVADFAVVVTLETLRDLVGAFTRSSSSEGRARFFES